MVPLKCGTNRRQRNHLAPAAENKIRLVYILAASHSGSTLLAMLLGAHTEICTVGELKATSLGDAERYRCSCLKRIRECSFWNTIGQEMRRRGFAFDVTNAGTEIRVGASPYVCRLLGPLHRGPFLEGLRDTALALSPSWRTQLARVQALNANLMDCLLALTKKKLIVDSSKIGIRLKYLLRNSAFDVRVIRLLRDGRGVALTYIDPANFADTHDPSLRGGGTGLDRDAKRLSMREAAREWRRSNEEAEAILGPLDRSRWIEVHYEALCTQPMATLQCIFSFLGVDPTQARLDFRQVEHHVIGNGMRLDATREICLDERWKSVLSAAELEAFDSVAGDLNRGLGYS